MFELCNWRITRGGRSGGNGESAGANVSRIFLIPRAGVSEEPPLIAVSTRRKGEATERVRPSHPLGRGRNPIEGGDFRTGGRHAPIVDELDSEVGAGSLATADRRPRPPPIVEVVDRGTPLSVQDPPLESPDTHEVGPTATTAGEQLILGERRNAETAVGGAAAVAG